MKSTRKRTTTQGQSPAGGVSLLLKRRLREGALIGVIAVSLFLMLALLTYHSSDPSWSHSGSARHIQNAGGHVGAWFADIFFYIFGYVAYIFPIFVAYGARVIYNEQAQQEDGIAKYMLALRGVGLLLMLVGTSGLTSLLVIHHGQRLPFDTGGVLGLETAQALASAFNRGGTLLFLSTCVFIGLTLFSGFSWLKGLRKLGLYCWEGFKAACDALMLRFAEFGEKRRQAKLHRQQTKTEKTTTPVIHREPSAKKPTRQISEPALQPSVAAVAEITTPAPPVDMKRTRSVFTKPRHGRLPPLSLLDPPEKTDHSDLNAESLQQTAQKLEACLQDFNVDARVVAIHPGPVVTRYELQPAPGLKVSKVTGLAKDLARSLSVISVRVVEVIPGKSVIGLELPNKNREIVRLSEVLSSKAYQHASSAVSLALGKDIAGHPVVVDVAKMPHLLVAGTTGAGKSVALNAMLLSILYKASPEEVRLLMIDPKMLELSIYDGVPHLLTPVVTDMKEAGNALRWCVAEMERRYQLMASVGVRNLAGYNKKVKSAISEGKPIPDPLVDQNLEDEPKTLEPLPNILVIADEFADMMMVVGKVVEELIARIAQKARAAGIHLILATQRPSVDVITGLIKANVPTRIAFQVSSKIDSRTILDQPGAEQLLGNGDMLYLAPGTGVPVRVHGAFVADNEVHRVVEALKASGEPEYMPEILAGPEADAMGAMGGLFTQSDSDVDALYDQAVAIVTESRKASISYVQRRLKIGYNRAARMIEEMETAGVVSAMGNNGTREVLAPPPPRDS